MPTLLATAAYTPLSRRCREGIRFRSLIYRIRASNMVASLEVITDTKPGVAECDVIGRYATFVEVRLAQVDVKIFGLQGPLRINLPLGTGTKGPAGTSILEAAMAYKVTGPQIGISFHPANSKATRDERHKVADRVAKTPS